MFIINLNGIKLAGNGNKILLVTNYKVRVDQSKKYELTKVKCGTSFFFSTSRPQYEKKKYELTSTPLNYRSGPLKHFDVARYSDLVI